MKSFKIDYLTNLMQHDYKQTILPTLLYITKQYFNIQKNDRLRHSHEGICELLLVYEGSGIYVGRDMVYPIKSGDVLLCNQGIAHEVQSNSDDEIGIYCFGLKNIQFTNLPENCLIDHNRHPVRSSGVLFPFLYQLCEQAYCLLGVNEILEKATAQSIAVTLLLMGQGLEEQHPIPVMLEQVQRIREYLDEHYTETITLGLLAAHFNCSTSYISHVFKKETGYSPIQYVVRRRIGLAQTYLIASDYNATYIAALVGYDNSNYFNTIFSKNVGISPIQYRKTYLRSLRGKRAQ